MDFDVEGDRRVRCKASSAAVYGRVPSFLFLARACIFGSRKEKIAAAEDGKSFSRCEHRGERVARRVRGADEQYTRKQSRSFVSQFHSHAPDDRRRVRLKPVARSTKFSTICSMTFHTIRRMPLSSFSRFGCATLPMYLLRLGAPTY